MRFFPFFLSKGRRGREKEEKTSSSSSYRRETPQQVERSSALVVGLDQPPRVRDPRGLGGLGPVDDVPAVRREHAAVGLLLEIGRARLGKLARHAPDLDDGDAATEHGDDGHLEEHAEGVADAVGGEISKRLGAVSAFEKRVFFLRCFLCEFRVLLSSFFLSACSASFGLSIPKRERGICGGIAKREFFRVCRGVEVFFFYPRCREREKSEKASERFLALSRRLKTSSESC